MTANEDAVQDVLTRMGVPENDLPDAIAATEVVLNLFRTSDSPAVTAQWECAAEFVGTFAALTGFSGSELLQVQNLARVAHKLRRF